jgi:hypothetical protein
MRVETRTRMMPQHYNVYIADDGTEFSSSIECENYEEGQKKIVVEGVIWYDREGNVLPLALASWEKVAAIHFKNDDADYDLYNALEASEFDMRPYDQAKFSAFGNSPMRCGESYLILYDGENEVWEDVADKYKYIKKWLDKI